MKKNDFPWFKINSSTFAMIEKYLFHILKHIRRGDSSWSFLYDFLVSSLHGAISTKEGNGVAVLIS